MSIQTAFRKAFEPSLTELGFKYWKKGFYKYNPEGEFVYGVTMEIGFGKRDLTTHVMIACFIDRLELFSDTPELNGSYRSVPKHPLYEQKAAVGHDRMPLIRNSRIPAFIDFGPYNDATALAQFSQQRDFMLEYILPDMLAIQDAKSLFKYNWDELRPLYEQNPDPFYSYPNMSSRVLYEAIQAGEKEAALQAMERVLYFKESRYLSALNRDVPDEKQIRKAHAEFEKTKAVQQAILDGNDDFLSQCLAERIAVSRATCDTFFKRFR